ncbi:bacterial Ig-like domain-containing protein [Enterococcus gilvus]|uniref:bacterial Ig-like domain-containing protein n=1 Tax=Enterococcus gilvus TaxID=160453 RepID=UPI0028D66893|nr:bacterial Ig-like domain-containing protein [Enterococcus gilvus]
MLSLKQMHRYFYLDTREVKILIYVSSLLAIFLFLTSCPTIVRADSMYQAGGLSVDLRTDLPYGIEMTHENGIGADGSYGGKIQFKLYGTIDTSETVSISALTFPTSGLQYALMIHLPENISVDNFKAAYDKAYKDNPADFYSISGHNNTRINISSTTGMRTFKGSSDDNSPGWKDDTQSYEGIDTEHQVMFCQRGDSVDLSTGKIYDIWKSEPDSTSIKFELHFAIDVATLMKDGDPNDYTPNKVLTKQRIPVSNTDKDNQENNKFKLTADFFGRTYKVNSGLSADTTNTINYRWKASPDMWLRASSLLSAKNGDSDNKNHQIVTGIPSEVNTWSSYISPWDSGDSQIPLSNYNQQDSSSFPEVPGVTKMLPGDFLNPSFTINQRQDNPANWTDNYVNDRFARVINFNKHQIDENSSVSVSSSKNKDKTIYSFSGKDGRGAPLVAPPLDGCGQPTDNTKMTVTTENYVPPSVIEVSTKNKSAVFHQNQKIPIVFKVNAPTSRKVEIEEKVTGEVESDYQTIGVQDLRSLIEDGGALTFDLSTLPLTKPGKYKITFRVTDIDDKGHHYSNEKSLDLTIDNAELKVKDSDSMYQYESWGPEKEVLSLIDGDGNKGKIEDVSLKYFSINGEEKKAVNNIDTKVTGEYEIDYEYLGLRGKTLLTIMSSKAYVSAHDGRFPVGTKFDPEKLFDSAGDNSAKSIAYERVKVSYTPTKVDDQHPGSYTITYDISDIVGHKTKISINWTYFYNNDLEFKDLNKAEMQFETFKYNGKSHRQTLPDCQMTILDTTDPKTSNPWQVQVAFDTSDANTKKWLNSNLSLTLNPSSVDYVNTKSNVNIDNDFQTIASLNREDVDNKKTLTSLHLNPTINIAKNTPSNNYQAKILWNLSATP